jgi:large conductance mechanosensitive channel
MWKDFKKFITKGNVLDLAVAVVIGAAFGAVVNGLVNDIIMPIIGYLTAGINFSDFKIVLAEASMEGAKVIKPETAITYGHLLQVIIQFLVIALAVFLIVRLVSQFQKKKEEAPKPEVKPEDTVLLTEIRDLLKNK